MRRARDEGQKESWRETERERESDGPLASGSLFKDTGKTRTEQCDGLNHFIVPAPQTVPLYYTGKRKSEAEEKTQQTHACTHTHTHIICLGINLVHTYTHTQAHTHTHTPTPPQPKFEHFLGVVIFHTTILLLTKGTYQVSNLVQS